SKLFITQNKVISIKLTTDYRCFTHYNHNLVIILVNLTISNLFWRNSVALALFDLDNTLLNGDSDHAWGHYLAEIGAVDKILHERKQDEFYLQYVAGELDIVEFLTFQLFPLTQYPLEQLTEWRSIFIETVIKPMISSGKPELIEQHRNKGDTLVIITATNDFITRPIADLLEVETLIATQAEFINNKYTGKISGTPCFQTGKITRLNEWLASQKIEMQDSWFYSDSINDLPLLEVVDNPVAVTPDSKLRAHAEHKNWPIID
ncbi:UNVERIFIED_CONTAM: hypothetical protein GTU68_063352, partial [Idotea baltica]|nr:hypothetical protein [Idotea baltica]